MGEKGSLAHGRKVLFMFWFIFKADAYTELPRQIDGSECLSAPRYFTKAKIKKVDFRRKRTKGEKKTRPMYAVF